MLRTGEISPRSAQPIAAAAKRIQGIVELTVDFSRAQSAAVMPISLAPSELGAVFEDVLAETRVRHPSTDFVLKGADVNTAGLWDRGRISQLLSNLLENA